MNRALFDKAKAVRDMAHAPYSKFHVGAAILTEAGTTHVGANVENASYPEGWCGETSAIAAMVAANPPGPGRRIAEITVVADRIEGRLTTPCGGCRQRIAEFATVGTPVHVIDPSGEGQTYRIEQLLPSAFEMEDTR
ncbi:MAG TPA: cytidine deaminase [Bauldia sp.]|nr:cytidine deaminase [Bauldia sp.]